MVIHIQNTPIASGAVMAPLRFEYIAHEAVASSFVFGVAQMEAPENGHLPRVSSHRLQERPHEHEEENMKEGQHDTHVEVVYTSRVESAGNNKERIFLLITRGPQTRTTYE
jgi:S-adenosylmethionine synthetase